MNLHELNTQARAGRVEELNLIAIEGGDFLLEARCSGHAHPLTNIKGSRLKVHSMVEAHHLLEGLPTLPLNLVHWSVQDEMCGMADIGEEDLKLPLPRRSPGS
ncbi:MULTISPECIES: DUF6482 family protein [unclassified Pseudomonas]|uniref:DUF6482 family protein n=1 Tax=unclassified Pseudomonas TaxID=196821 RepID=UPI000BA2F2A7|nr:MULTISPECIES: DUF6482 family protein [unclassified Pseudomonas]MCU1723188.1 DUF6482 family protein [Pseudomonas sp. 5P_5.1_Bac1]MCU1731601.1 DUF6482 family protein [Pseudomonas sp. 20P_3.2_Bac4]MCU1745778.1 DUF6482 family protein [Pseudomonas sp. 20P_3.2_Bac5]